MCGMDLSFRFSREITVAGFAPDADPNVTPPSAAHVWEMEGQTNGQLARGHAVVAAFDTAEPTGTLQFKTWWKDNGPGGTGEWFILAAAQTATHRQRYVTTDLIGGSVFLQALALASTGAATKVTLRAGEF